MVSTPLLAQAARPNTASTRVPLLRMSVNFWSLRDPFKIIRPCPRLRNRFDVADAVGVAEIVDIRPPGGARIRRAGEVLAGQISTSASRSVAAGFTILDETPGFGIVATRQS